MNRDAQTLDPSARTRRSKRTLGVRLRAYMGLGWAAAVVVGTLWGCGTAVNATAPGSEYSGGGVPGTGGSGSGMQSGLPCDVADVIATYCLDCHSNSLAGGAPFPLMSYADLTAPAPLDPTKSVAERSVIRMQDAAAPMPPGAGTSVPAADVAILQAWIDAGMPEGNCETPDAGPDPFDAPAVCSSDKYWTQGDHGSRYMYPGRACIDCHANSNEEDAPIFAIAGTVYPTPHEPDSCVSTGVSDAIVRVTEKDGTVHDLKVNSSGNFMLETFGFQYPYTAKLLFNGGERVMHAEQTSGDCNACHTQDGTQGAPGRILLP